MRDALDAKVFRWSLYLSRLPTAAEEEDPDEDYLFPPHPGNEPTQLAVPKLGDLVRPEASVDAAERRWLYRRGGGLWYHVHSHRLWIRGVMRGLQKESPAEYPVLQEESADTAAFPDHFGRHRGSQNRVPAVQDDSSRCPGHPPAEMGADLWGT
eukprot:GHVS01077397.1.p1 GENE.GHVS01077397.1~~GHVS01077397.1.p1  ORF type:complete len:154 (+),score=12.55 GHVS01077397.1:1001-1462(+)